MHTSTNQKDDNYQSVSMYKKITDTEFQKLCTLIYNRLGICLSEQKRSLLVGRLQKLLNKHGFNDFNQYYKHVVSDKTGTALNDLTNRITTNHTYFNRENAHFEFFKNKALPELEKHLTQVNTNDIRIWCAGCSSGEESYMLAMLLLDFFQTRINIAPPSILATDISERALDIAKAGIYQSEKIDRIPGLLKQKYFKHTGKDEWKVKKIVRNQIIFRRFNLMNEQIPFKRAFHIIFCRNVMIYFDKETCKNLVSRFHRFTEPNGYFFIGHSESLGRFECPYKYIMPAVYKK